MSVRLGPTCSPLMRIQLGLALLAASAAISAPAARASGGPDAWGMTWKSSVDPGGPVFAWVDISTLGSEVQGLLDDNSVGPFDLGLGFPYYWTTVADFVVGSNGWISFEPGAHFVPCLPTIPTPGGGGDQIVAPFMSDLTFVGAGNPGSVRYWHDAIGQRTVISFLSVPFWSGGAPGWVGSNTFQIILSAVDGSITFQYLDVDPAAFTPDPSCASNLEVGIENLTGNIGLEVSLNVVPPDGWAVRFDPPPAPTLLFADPGVSRVLGPGDRARFFDRNGEVAVRAGVRNFGSAPTTGDVTATARLFDADGGLLEEQQQTITTLASLEERLLEFAPWGGLTEGGYAVELSVAGGGDINPGNNTRLAELRAIDRLASPVILDYVVVSEVPGVFDQYSGAGVRFLPFPLESRIEAIDVLPVGTAPSPAGFALSIFADDAAGGGPGTQLGFAVVPPGSFLVDEWVPVIFDPPVLAPCGSFYVGFSPTGPGLGIGTGGAGPPSRQTLELANGAWRPFRYREGLDFMIRAHVAAPDPSGATIFCDAFELGDSSVWSSGP